MIMAQYECHVGSFAGQGEYVEVQTDPGFASGLAVVASPAYVFFEKGTPGAKTTRVGCFYQASEAGTFELSVSGDPCAVAGGSGPVSSGYTWDADAGVSGAKYFNIARDEKSTSPSGTVFTVTFTPDEGTNTMESAANVVFVEWETITWAHWPAERSRKELGVGETVRVRFCPVVPFASYGCTASDEGLVRVCDDYRYVAPALSCCDTVSFKTPTAEECQISFEIVEPSSIAVLAVTGTVENVVNVAGTFRMHFYLVLCPTNVSFVNNVEIAEMAAVSTNAVGYFANPDLAGMLDHGRHGAGRWIEIRENNKAGHDIVGPGMLYSPFSDGSFTWPIPNHWRLMSDCSDGKFFVHENQRFAITSNGTVKVWKFGKKGERALNSDTMTITDEVMP